MGKIPGELPRLSTRSNRRFEDSPELRAFIKGYSERKKRHIRKPPRIRSYIPEDVPTPQDPPTSDFAVCVRQAKTAKEKSLRQLANRFTQEVARVGLEAVNKELANEGISHHDMTRVQALLTLPEKVDKTLACLSSNHAYVVVKAKELTTNAERIIWLKKAVKHGLTPLQLKRSITAGRIVTREDVRLAGNRNSGIDTIENVCFLLKRWIKRNPIEQMTEMQVVTCLTTLKPFFDLAATLGAMP